jgi:PAS domain S-box-containing protein
MTGTQKNNSHRSDEKIAFAPTSSLSGEMETLNAPESERMVARLRTSEAKYRTLFNSIDQGFCVIEMLFDERDRPVDYRFLEVNATFEQQTGLTNVVGKWVSELVPDLEAYWFEMYGKVAWSGEPVRFENHAHQMGRSFDVYAFRIGEPTQRQVALLFKDITARKEVEAKLRASAERHAFRVALADALRPINDPIQIQSEACRVLGEHLSANRVTYFEVIGPNYVIARDYVQDTRSIAGNHPIAAFSDKLLAAYGRGHTVVEKHVQDDLDLSLKERAAYAALQIGAYIGVPLIKEGEFVAGLAVHTIAPRDWTPDEVALVEETAERTWAAVKQARAEAALRQSEERLRTIIDSARDYAIFCLDLEGTVTSWNTGAERLFGYSEAEIIGVDGRIIYTPEDRAINIPEYEMQKAREAGYAENERWHLRKDNSRFFASGMIRPIRDESGRLTGFTKVARDSTARHLAEQRTLVLQQLAAELSVQMTSYQMEATINRAIDHAFGEASVSTFLLSANKETLIRLTSEEESPALQHEVDPIPLTSRLPLTDAVRSGEIIPIPSQDEYLKRYPHLAELIIEQDFHAAIALPLIVNKAVIGGTTVTFQQPNELSSEESELLRAISHLYAQALQRARLFEMERQARHEAALRAERLMRLQGVTAKLSQVLTFEQVAQLMVDEAINALGASTGAFNLLEGNDTFAVIYAVGSRMPEEERKNWLRYPVNGQTPSGDAALRREPIWLESRADLLNHYPTMTRIAELYPGAWIALPLFIEKRIIGVLGFAFAQAHQFHQEERNFMLALAHQCAQAVERARLYEQSKAIAALEERQRLARELHDAVSQTLFSATTIAQSLPGMWSINPDRALILLQDTVKLNRAAMAEMRTLLLELRPEGIVRTSLNQLIEQLVTALQGRRNIQVDYQREGTEVRFEPDVHVALYRIAQESLNNIAKHSKASRARVLLKQDPKGVMLSISDNGIGFDPSRTTSGFGMTSIRERAEKIGAVLEMETAPGRGTQIFLKWAGE